MPVNTVLVKLIGKIRMFMAVCVSSNNTIVLMITSHFPYFQVCCVPFRYRAVVVVSKISKYFGKFGPTVLLHRSQKICFIFKHVLCAPGNYLRTTETNATKNGREKSISEIEK